MTRPITDDQARLRANLKEMPSSAAAYKRYREKFDDQQTQIENLQADIKALQATDSANGKPTRTTSTHSPPSEGWPPPVAVLPLPPAASRFGEAPSRKRHPTAHTFSPTQTRAGWSSKRTAVCVSSRPTPAASGCCARRGQAGAGLPASINSILDKRPQARRIPEALTLGDRASRCCPAPGPEHRPPPPSRNRPRWSESEH
jgi:hypothetical protein